MITKEEITEFLNNCGALIVEPSSSFYSLIRSCLVGFGMDGDKILTAGNYSDAINIIDQVKPKILITEYHVGKKFGLEIVDKHSELFDNFSRISIMVTKESSDNAVAEAAEEQLDAYIVKPFSPVDFEKKFQDVVARKIRPSGYIEKIRSAKELIKENKLKEAIPILEESKSLTEKPTLACYYLGDIQSRLGNFTLAREEFAKGRVFIELHYKCLTGEFDCLMQEKKYNEAYGLVSLIRAHYPVTSYRLGNFFISAVYTENFQDISGMYDLYVNLEYRPPNLVHLVSLALLTAGRFYLRKTDTDSGINYFELAATASGRNIDILERIIEELLKTNAYLEAEKFLRYIKSADLNSAKHNQLNFRIGVKQLSADSSLELGKKLMAQGQLTPVITEALVKIAVERKKLPLAESFILAGAGVDINFRKALYSLLEKVTPPKSGESK
ncbi:MAG: hypothetical protein B7Y39_13860 [Bdellovibrio sp. 28-41-41]|nr:MAG: hypothetical protein B7Y39_13860 [Bdellovibrio sp. 28-41-41]